MTRQQIYYPQPPSFLFSGLETVRAIRNVKTNKADKPYKDIKIANLDFE